MKRFQPGARIIPAFLASVTTVVVAGAVVISSGGGSEPADDATPATAIHGVAASPVEVYDPVSAGEEVPSGFRQLLPRDAIRPVYDPTFVAAGEIDWPETALVIGLELNGEARAYPVGFLNRREMVIDSVAGIPVLVTW